MRFCRILWSFLLFLPFFVVAEPVTNEIEVHCLDPDCSTPFYDVELIVDLPELALHKGTTGQVYAYHALEDSYRIKIGDQFHEVHRSFLRISGGRPHESTAIVKVKQTRPDISIPQEETKIEEISPPTFGSTATGQDGSDFKLPKVAYLETRTGGVENQSPSPSSSLHHTEIKMEAKPPEDEIPQNVYLHPGPELEDSRNNTAPIPFKDSTNRNPTLEEPQYSDKVEVDSPSSGSSKTIVGTFENREKTFVNHIELEKSEPETQTMNSFKKVGPSLQDKESKTEVKLSEGLKTGTRLDSKLEEPTSLETSSAQAPATEKPEPSTFHKEDEARASPLQENTVETVVESPENTGNPVVSSNKLRESGNEVLSQKPHSYSKRQETDKKGKSPHDVDLEVSAPQVSSFDTSAQTSQILPASDQESKDVSEVQPQPPKENTGTVTETFEFDDEVETGDVEKNSLLDITKESTFFHCLYCAANGSFSMLDLDQFFSAQEKSHFAGIVLSCARYYFNAAQLLLLKFPTSVVSPLDRILTYTFRIRLTFFTSWVLFVFSLLIAWLVVKLFNRLLFADSTTGLNDPSRRSLDAWLAVEESANLLAGSMADKEEAYAHLVVWSTKVTERYENQLRDAKKELAALRTTHDDLVDQLSAEKTKAKDTVTHLRERVASLTAQMERTQQYRANIAEEERVNNERISALNSEKAMLMREVQNYRDQVETAEKTIIELEEAKKLSEENLAARERELSSLQEAFIQLRSAELKRRKKTSTESYGKVEKDISTSNEDRVSTDGWEVEDELEVEEIIKEVEVSQEQQCSPSTNEEEGKIRLALEDFLEVGRLRVQLEEVEKRARTESAAKARESELRMQLQETVENLQNENSELSQKLREATEDCEAAKKKLEILSDYFKEREAAFQRDLGRKAFTESEAAEELAILRDKQQSLEVEVKTLKDQVSSSRRELAESERASRRHISELDRRLHESFLTARDLENTVKDLRSENALLRQKMFIGDRGIVHQMLAGMPPPPPPPPPPGVVLGSASKSPENRSLSRQSAKSGSSHPPLPFLTFGQMPLPGGVPLPPPPPPPPPPGLFGLQRQLQGGVNRQSPMMSSWESSRSPPNHSGSTNSGSNRSSKQLR